MGEMHWKKSLSSSWRCVGLRNPNQVWIIRAPFIPDEIPVFTVLEPGAVAVEESKLRATAVEVGMHIILLRHAREFAVVEQPHHERGMTDGRKLHLVAGSPSVDMVV